MRDHLLKPEPRAATAFFCYWGSEDDGRAALPPGAFAALRDAPNPWVRSLLFISCFNECNQEWVNRLMRDLREYKRSLSTSEIQLCLVRLDDRSYKVRAEAARALFSMREPALAPLRKAAADKTLSIEVRTAAARIVERIENAEPSIIEEEAIGYAFGLAYTHGNREAIRVLDVVANNGSDAWVTRQAKKRLESALERRKQDH